MKRALFTLIAFLLNFPIHATPTTYTIKDLGTRNLYALQLDGELEKNIAVSRFITGTILYDSEKSELSGNWEIDMRTLDTQNEMRNLELREQVLKVPENPILRVQLAPVAAKTLFDEKPHSLSSPLLNTYAGKTHSPKAQIKITYFKESKKSQQRLPGNLLRMQITQEWSLEPYGLLVSENFKPIFPGSFVTMTDLVASDSLPTDKPIFPEAPKPR